MSQSLCSVELRSGKDVVFARQQARYLAGMLGFDVQDQACIAAAVSEVARNAWQYAKGGRAEFFLDLAQPQALIAEITDHGPGIPELKTLLQGTATSHNERVTGIPGIRRLMDQFTIDSGPKGTVVRFGKQPASRRTRGRINPPAHSTGAQGAGSGGPACRGSATKSGTARDLARASAKAAGCRAARPGVGRNQSKGWSRFMLSWMNVRITCEGHRNSRADFSRT